MTKRVSDDWKKIQEKTFTNWVNNALRGHLKTAKNQVTSLQTDLRDGTLLAELLETISKKKVGGRIVANPTLKAHELENLCVSFNFMERERIKLVNIGEHVYGSAVCVCVFVWLASRVLFVLIVGDGA